MGATAVVVVVIVVVTIITIITIIITRREVIMAYRVVMIIVATSFLSAENNITINTKKSPAHHKMPNKPSIIANSTIVY